MHRTWRREFKLNEPVGHTSTSSWMFLRLYNDKIEDIFCSKTLLHFAFNPDPSLVV